MSDIVIVCPRKRKVVSTGLTIEMIIVGINALDRNDGPAAMSCLP